MNVWAKGRTSGVALAKSSTQETSAGFPPDDEHDDSRDETQGHHVAQDALGIVALALAQAQGCQRIAAVADEHGDGHEHDHDGIGHRHSRKAISPTACPRNTESMMA